MTIEDRSFNKMVEDITNSTEEEVFLHIKNLFLSMSLDEQNKLKNYLNEFGYWGKLDMESDNYETFHIRAKVLKEHIKDFSWLYKKVKDYRSKRVLFFVLHNWYNLATAGLRMIRDNTFSQYFDLDILKCDKNEVIVDLGAYKGDTIQSYLKEYGVDSYKKIYAYEISNNIYNELKNNLINYNNIYCFNKAVTDKVGLVGIQNHVHYDTANKVSEDSDILVESTYLDEDIKEKITLLKMDIEGSEKLAINGSKNHIINDNPKLLLSVYHNYEDLYKVPRMIDKLNKNYDYYLRYYGYFIFPSEIVLFAIPKESE